MDKTMECPKCKKAVKATKKMFNTYVCDECGTIISSDYSMDKVGK